ncbi:sensor histidine kinase [Poseidonibacter lekithochrous]|uniref:HAMP domain-containing sensor histidine kinase n=1 Tax=Poseidonibacter lekithochrous TaxID=1904463 RepID=UPI0008FC2168|nr:HAMP domain-containing sensor histidine kinase [Poseidonibacter lekithochrous]QKJ22976.1 two-component system sensor histidine kinase [Poseidonibacter lekithochrous]
MSFKYRFIVSFVLLEAFFIILIVTMNFIAINNSSDKLIKDKINSNVSFLEELLKVPLSIYDLATIDNLLVKTQELDYVNSIILLDSQNRVLSEKFNFKDIKIEDIIKVKDDFVYSFENEFYKLKYKELLVDDSYLGAMYIIFDLSENQQFIQNNKETTLIIIAIEILISTILSYIIGSKLTVMLTRLSEVSQEIGEGKNPDIPYQNKTNEMGILANSLHQMKLDLQERRSKLKTLALELNNQKNELLEANKSKDDFLANMSHELKTPLNSINVISSIMMKNKKNRFDENEVKNLSIINSCGNDLLFLINDVLDISKLEAGEIHLDCTTLDIYALMSDINNMFLPQVEQKKLDFIFECDKNIGYFYCDGNRVKQIIKNLLSNSLKFVKDGSIKLLVKKLDNNIEIMVKDDGIGIPEDKLEHIFDRFKQVDGSTTRKFGGTGLGLAICKELTTLMDGEIEVKSKVNVGTIFRIVLPINEDKVDMKNVNYNETAVLDENTEAAQKRILLFNNDPLVFFSVVVELNKNYELTQTSNINEFFKKSNDELFDFIIIDISTLSSNDLDKLFTINDGKLILISDSENAFMKDNRVNQNSIINKPLDKNKLISLMQNEGND